MFFKMMVLCLLILLCLQCVSSESLLSPFSPSGSDVTSENYRPSPTDDLRSVSLHKRYLDSLATDIFKRERAMRLGSLSREALKLRRRRRFIDGIGSDIFKKSSKLSNLPKIYFNAEGFPDPDSSGVDNLASPNVVAHRKLNLNFHGGSRAEKVLKFNDTFGLHIPSYLHSGHKRYLESIASDIFKRDHGQDKRFLDGIASSLIKRNNELDPELDLYGFANDREAVNKRYLEGIASSLIKKDDGEKRYLEGIASSLILKGDGEKRYFDGIASSLIKKDDGEKRYLEGIASSVIKKSPDMQTATKRKHEVTDDVVDGSVSQQRLAKRDVITHAGLSGQGIQSERTSLRHRRDVRQESNSLRHKRFIESISSEIFKRRALGATLDPDSWHTRLFGERHVYKKRYLDDIASSLLQKRYLDTVASSLIKKSWNGMPGTYYRLPMYEQPMKSVEGDDERFNL